MREKLGLRVRVRVGVGGGETSVTPRGFYGSCICSALPLWVLANLTRFGGKQILWGLNTLSRRARFCLASAEVMIPSPPPTGHGGVWRQPCRPRLLAGRSLSSAALSWSDDDVYRLARALASWHRACFLVSSTLSGSVVDFLDRRHREQHDGIWSSRVST